MNLESLRNKMSPLMQSSLRSKILAAFVASFAFVYHFSFMWVFYSLGVLPMFYFNIGSTLLFTAMGGLVISWRPAFWMYAVCFLEVVVHQILAEYYIGSQTDFHFFILLMGMVPFIVFPRNPKLSFVLGSISCAIFVAVEVMAHLFPTIYVLDEKIVFIIRTFFHQASLLLSGIQFFLFRYFSSYINIFICQVTKFHLKLYKFISEYRSKLKVQF